VDSRAVEELRALAARDRELEERASSLRSLDAAVAEIRERAEAITAFFAGLAAQDQRLREIEARERDALSRRCSELKEARAGVEGSRSDEERLLAEKRLARAVDHVKHAERALEQARGERRAFDKNADRLTGELSGLQARARAMGASDEDIVRWASHKHAELFVALGQLNTERERVIREVNELATSLVGEPTFGWTPAQVLARVERLREASAG
jgi:DNA repair exonuclease SbcCD ATPase subunit